MNTDISFVEMGHILTLDKHAPFLCELKEEAENELHITICRSEVVSNIESNNACDNANIEKILKHCKAIMPYTNQEIEIIFKSYIIYQVRNESFCSYDPEEIRIGNYLIVFEKSKLLDYLSISTDACQFDDGTFYPAKWKHYGIYTQNHIIDVISQTEPMVSIYQAKRQCQF